MHEVCHSQQALSYIILQRQPGCRRLWDTRSAAGPCRILLSAPVTKEGGYYLVRLPSPTRLQPLGRVCSRALTASTCSMCTQEVTAEVCRALRAWYNMLQTMSCMVSTGLCYKLRFTLWQCGLQQSVNRVCTRRLPVIHHHSYSGVSCITAAEVLELICSPIIGLHIVSD